MTDLLSIAAFAADQIPTENLPYCYSVNVEFVITSFGPIVEIGPSYRMERTVNRTATILAEMRAENDAALAAHAERMADRAKQASKGKVLPSPLRERTTARLNAEQQAEKAALLKGLDDGMGNSWNSAKLVAGVAKRRNGQLKYARPGKAKPDMLDALMAYFSSPSWAMDELQCTPGPVSKAAAQGLLSDAYAVDVIEGLGFTVPQGATLTGLLKGLNAVCGVNGRGNGRGRPRKMVERTVEPFSPLPGHSRPYSSDALPVGRIPVADTDGTMSTPATIRYRNA